MQGYICTVTYCVFINFIERGPSLLTLGGGMLVRAALEVLRQLEGPFAYHCTAPPSLFPWACQSLKQESPPQNGCLDE